MRTKGGEVIKCCQGNIYILILFNDEYNHPVTEASRRYFITLKLRKRKIL